MAAQFFQEFFVIPMPTEHGLAIPVASIGNMAPLVPPALPPTVDIGQFLLPVETPELASALDSPSLSTSEISTSLQ
jgi:hypothetical protein